MLGSEPGQDLIEAALSLTWHVGIETLALDPFLNIFSNNIDNVKKEAIR